MVCVHRHEPSLQCHDDASVERQRSPHRLLDDTRGIHGPPNVIRQTPLDYAHFSQPADIRETTIGGRAVPVCILRCFHVHSGEPHGACGSSPSAADSAVDRHTYPARTEIQQNWFGGPSDG